jgi:hypothetical protein
MAVWEIECANCHKHFTHSQIPDELMNYYVPLKPPFPDGRSELECPHCCEKSVYQQHQLIYRE